MAIFRQYIAPLLVVLLFLVALVAVSARIFLPADMAAPAPIEENGETGRRGDGETFANKENNFSVSFSTPSISPNSLS
ncbi:hypothetical protein [Fischerella thermalis]|jgi:hypothetical protein|uniref:Uncharacterized protein n=1 Tax=Fischerella thermalis JSC-11 TaxID=741277 RepID=G6FQS1_9CYAN|nr:hypothetical protein [Fischerella thermalis]PLZ82605.1 hypothetical protein CBP16_06735 [Fischerella thermalis WC217]PMB06870.1 hypothetical protein CEN49_14410 [Fischerella thermalis CCMEE 5273]EHC18156.1 hypothetical protein FJSC11DRAFT_1218 [Fischerella thermalis JSC-11]PLZ08885.1 hypothetical protein CBP18_12930 [Fischerella thermalis WC119]PLZ09422.1 hypothetical protein CBP17_14485 [Fischerella thermalis WC114]